MHSFKHKETVHVNVVFVFSKQKDLEERLALLEANDVERAEKEVALNSAKMIGVEAMNGKIIAGGFTFR